MVDIETKRLDRVFHALANSTRRRILWNLLEGEATVRVLAAPFEMSLAAVSKHLQVLERAGLIARTIEGRETVCRVETSVLDEAAAALDHYRDFWNSVLTPLPSGWARRAMPETLVVMRTFEAPVAQVYAAWTDPQRMAMWFFAGPEWTAEVEADVRVGGAFRIVMNPPDGAPLESHGTFLELIPPRRIRLRWNSYADTNMTVTVEFDPTPDGTQLRLTHSGLPSAEVSARHSTGWGLTLDHLGRALAI